MPWFGPLIAPKASPDPWLDWLSRPPGARARLLCLAHSGGGKEAFRAWPARLPDVEICAASLPGRGRRIAERPMTDAVEVASALATSLERDGAGGWVVFGHSTGAIIGFELMRELRRRGLGLARALIASASGAPDLPARTALHRLPDAELVEVLKKLDGNSGQVLDHPELRELFLPIIRADAELGESYRFVEAPPLEVRLAAYAGVLDPHVPVQDVAAWARHGTNAQVRRFAGGHFYFNDDADAFFARLGHDLA